MTPQQADQAIQQVQNAHRLVVAYYQRMLQTLEAIANQQNCSFHWWGSQYFAQPCRESNKICIKIFIQSLCKFLTFFYIRKILLKFSSIFLHKRCYKC